MNYKLSKHASDVVSSRDIKLEWLEYAVDHPTAQVTISSIEKHLFSTISQNENRCLKVVVNPLTKTIITAYFDRNMRKRGCK